MMDESSFHERADACLEELLDAIEMADESGEIDADIQQGVLSIILPDESEYVINKHQQSSQIWVSSPISGALYFSYNISDDEWVNDDDEQLLQELLYAELSASHGLELDF